MDIYINIVSGFFSNHILYKTRLKLSHLNVEDLTNAWVDSPISELLMAMEVKLFLLTYTNAQDQRRCSLCKTPLTTSSTTGGQGFSKVWNVRMYSKCQNCNYCKGIYFWKCCDKMNVYDMWAGLKLLGLVIDRKGVNKCVKCLLPLRRVDVYST